MGRNSHGSRLWPRSDPIPATHCQASVSPTPQSTVSPCPLSRLARSASLAPLGAGSLPRSTALHPFRREPRPGHSETFPPTQLPVSLASPLPCTQHGGAAAGWQPARAVCLLSPQRCDVPSPSSTAPPPAPRSQQPPPPAANAPWKRLRPLGLRLRDDSAERLLTVPGSVSLPRTHCRLRLLR